MATAPAATAAAPAAAADAGRSGPRRRPSSGATGGCGSCSASSSSPPWPGAAWVLTQVPLPPEAALPQTTIIYDAAGNQLATLHGQENRFPVKLDQVPAIVQSAVIAAEDRKFFQHGGIDPLGIARATWADIRKKGATQGGSTITQQYVKQVYVGSDPTLWRKLREAVIAIKLERKLDKRQILERYLNTVYFGRGAYGIQAASRTWFDKDVDQLGLKEAAYLVGLIRSPSGGDVVADTPLAYELRTFVLQAMVETKAITPAQMAEVEAIKLESYVAPRTEIDSEVALPGIGAEYYVQYVRQQLEKTYSEDFVLRQGLRVQTSLDPELQRQAYEAVYGLLDEPGDPAGALVAINQDGQVVAMVGGRDWDQSQVNLAVGDEGGGSGRQGGSTFKPFALAEAVREGYSLESSFRGPAKIVLPGADRGNDWEVTNYENASFGQVNLIDATVDSVNTVYAQLVDTLGPEKVVDMATQLGITSELAPVASIALGTQNVSVLEMANAYSTLARGGVRYEPQVITEVKMADTVLPDSRAKGVRVLEKSQADQVNFVLEQVVARGSGTGAQVKNTKVTGKTGTTEDYGDAWFVGSTRSLTVAVWMGYPEGQSEQLLNIHGVKKVNGGSLPARIFQRFVERPGPGERRQRQRPARLRRQGPQPHHPLHHARPVGARPRAHLRHHRPLRRQRHPVRAHHHGGARRGRRQPSRRGHRHGRRGFDGQHRLPGHGQHHARHHPAPAGPQQLRHHPASRRDHSRRVGR